MRRERPTHDAAQDISSSSSLSYSHSDRRACLVNTSTTTSSATYRKYACCVFGGNKRLKKGGGISSRERRRKMQGVTTSGAASSSSSSSSVGREEGGRRKTNTVCKQEQLENQTRISGSVSNRRSVGKERLPHFVGFTLWLCEGNADSVKGLYGYFLSLQRAPRWHWCVFDQCRGFVE